MNAEDYRREYNRMVSEINRQISELEKIDPESVALKRYRNYFQPVTTISPNYRMMRKLYSVAKSVIRSNQLSPEADCSHRQYERINK